MATVNTPQLQQAQGLGNYKQTLANKENRVHTMLTPNTHKTLPRVRETKRRHSILSLELYQPAGVLKELLNLLVFSKTLVIYYRPSFLPSAFKWLIS